jgi:hypothetical protein
MAQNKKAYNDSIAFTASEKYWYIRHVKFLNSRKKQLIKKKNLLNKTYISKILWTSSPKINTQI